MPNGQFSVGANTPEAAQRGLDFFGCATQAARPGGGHCGGGGSQPTSENAVKTQIWCAIATYVLTAVIKKELHLDASLYTCLQILSVSVFEKTQLSCALQPDRTQHELALIANQLNLFEI
ncbi:hypothetical protein THIX_30383 [Thiomonas sp. X19]|nr:hypothetical protein THIX_30383 [Thiomonas sp. X19]